MSEIRVIEDVEIVYGDESMTFKKNGKFLPVHEFNYVDWKESPANIVAALARKEGRKYELVQLETGQDIQLFALLRKKK
jgi:hypothetical protein